MTQKKPDKAKADDRPLAIRAIRVTPALAPAASAGASVRVQNSFLIELKGGTLCPN
jgi:hypothetical protein